MATFNTIPNLSKALSDTLQAQQFTTMTMVQERSIPLILQGKDLLVQSKTGSGKTLAFALPSLMMTNLEKNTPQTLIITPTRELAEQIATQIQTLAAALPNFKTVTLYGGVPLRNQANSLVKGGHLLIGTPGRLLDHLSKGTLELKSIERIVLDEADRMLEMGFYDDILKIVSQAKNTKQRLLFSATFPDKIKTLAQTFLHAPEVISVTPEHQEGQIEAYVITTRDKPKTLQQIINLYRPNSLLIFCNTKADTIALTQRLQQEGHAVTTIHGDLDQEARQEAIIKFSNGSSPVLVATDVASRGIDIDNVELVVNYDLPFDKEVYTHRIGRTGRAGSTGRAVSLYTSGSTKTAYILNEAKKLELDNTQNSRNFKIVSHVETIALNGGKKQKLRKGDILGTFCKEMGLEPEQIGAITLMANRTYIAIDNHVLKKVLKMLESTRIKKKKYIAWIVD